MLAGPRTHVNSIPCSGSNSPTSFMIDDSFASTYKKPFLGFEGFVPPLLLAVLFVVVPYIFRGCLITQWQPSRLTLTSSLYECIPTSIERLGHAYNLRILLVLNDIVGFPLQL
jgi:hypothetical protein